MKKQALVVVDVQRAMFTVQGNLLYEGINVLMRIGQLIEQARSCGTTIIYIQHTSTSGVFLRDTDGWKIKEEIMPQVGDYVVEKSSWDGFYQTELESVLQKEKINELIVVGMQTEFCIDTTCRRAYSLGYQTTLVKDAHTTFDSEILKGEAIIAHHNQTLGGRFVTVATANEVVFK